MATRIRIRGIVRLANRVREQLAGPLPASQRDALRDQVAAAVGEVRKLCAQHGSSVQDLPAPSRHALAFLEGIDWQAVTIAEGAAARPRSPSAITFPGLQADLKGVMRLLEAPASKANHEQAYEWIRHHSRQIERNIERTGLSADRLTQSARDGRAWLALLAQREHFKRYVRAVDLAERAMRQALEQYRSVLKPPVRVWFQPMRPPAKARQERGGCLLQCRTAIIGFDEAGFAAVAEVLVGPRRRDETLHQAVLGPAYQAIDAELERLAGAVRQTAGAHHDLDDAFDRVNARYFNGNMQRPRLVWSRRLTRRKFGHYDHAHDTVMVSATLDQPQVPEFVVDYLVYHELLHKHHGIRWQNGRAHAHTSAFRSDERQFERFAEADEVLQQLARR